MKCLLCESETIIFHNTFFKCTHCNLIFKNPNVFLSHAEEYGRYELHQNQIDDENYINFLKKLIEPIWNQITPNMTHLDFGSGKAPVFNAILKNNIKLSAYYDPYYYPDKKLLEMKYDLVTCSEVVEHFNNPQISWEELIKTVRPAGFLAVMTMFYRSDTDFLNWWYKNDPTHVAFYQQETLEYLAAKYKMQIIYNDSKSVVIFQKV